MIKKRIVNITSLFISSILGKGFVFIVNILMAKYTSVDTYGRFVLVRSAINVAENSLSSAINPLIVTNSAREKDKLEYSIAYYICYGLTGVIVSTCVLIFLYGNSLIQINESDVNLYAYFVVPFFIISCFFNNALLAVNLGKEKFHPILVSSVLSFFLMILIVYYGRSNLNVYTAIFFLGVYHFLDFILKLFMNRSILKPVYCKNNIIFEIKKLLVKAKPLIISGLFNASVFFIIRYLLSISPNGYKKLAIFDIYFQLVILIMIITITLVNLVSTMMIKSDMKGFTFIKFYKKMSLYILPFIIISSIITYSVTGYFINLINPNLYFKGMELYIPFIALVFAISLIQNRCLIVFDFQKIMPKSVFISSLITISYAYLFANQPHQLGISYMIFYISTIIFNTWLCSSLGEK